MPLNIIHIKSLKSSSKTIDHRRVFIFQHNSLSAHGAQGTAEAGVAAVAVQPGPVLLLAPRHAARVLAAARLRQTEPPRARAPGLGAGAGVTAVHVGVLLTNQRSLSGSRDQLSSNHSSPGRPRAARRGCPRTCRPRPCSSSSLPRPRRLPGTGAWCRRSRTRGTCSGCSRRCRCSSPPACAAPPPRPRTAPALNTDQMQ